MSVRDFTVALGIAVIAMAASTAYPCSIPVFRYALDRWPADGYRLEVPQSAMSDPELAELLRNLGDDSPVNLEVVAPSDASPTISRLLFPRSDAAVWSGTLNPVTFKQLTESPARSEIAKRLLAGESGVWILIESGNKDTDDSHAARLEKRLAFLENVASLPTIDPSDPSNQLGPGPELRVKFSLLRVARADTREETLRAMLVGPSPDSSVNPTGPLAGVVFGRGRVLGFWPADELGDDSVDQACLYLLGACSCQVKQLNPGWDLLLSTHWDEELMKYSETHEPPSSVPAEPIAETVVIEGATEPEVSEPSGNSGVKGTTIAMVGAALFLGSLFALRLRR